MKNELNYFDEDNDKNNEMFRIYFSKEKYLDEYGLFDLNKYIDNEVFEPFHQVWFEKEMYEEGIDILGLVFS